MIALELGLGNTRLLEIELIEDGLLGLGHEASRSCHTPLSRPVRYAQAHYAANTIGPNQRCVPRNRSTPIVAHNHRLGSFECVEQADDVTDKMEQRELVNGFGAVRLAIASHVGGNSVEPCLSECRELMPP
jgi:hypothetical protein